jgi:beta-lactamase regulating signal transducer with metallopeptidase domain
MLAWLSKLTEVVSGWPILLDLALKSVVLLLLAGGAAWALRHSSAALRHLVWSVALAGLLVLPALALALPSWRVELLPAALTEAAQPVNRTTPLENLRPVDSVLFTPETNETATNIAAQPPLALPASAAVDEAPALTLGQATPSPARWQGLVAALNWKLILLACWLGGMLLVLARMAIGTARVWWLTRAAWQVTERSWIALARHLSASLQLGSQVTLFKSEQVAMPMTWGAWRSVVLLPAAADNWSDGCRSIVLLHELAHIKRRDCLTQTLAQVACAVYWFNPLVWLAARRLREERELACDDYVLGVGTKASEYATYLVEIAGGLHAQPQISPVAVGMACSQLESRVKAILNPQVKRAGLTRNVVWLATLGLVGLIVPLAMVQPWAGAHASTRTVLLGAVTQEPELAPVADLAALSALAQAGSVAAPAPLPSPAPEAHPAPVVAVDAEAVPAPDAEADTEEEDQDTNQNGNQNRNLSVDQLIEMKTHNVTPEFIDSIRRAGFDNLTVRQLVELRVHGIDENFVKEVSGWGFENATLRDLVQLRVAGVNPEYLAALKQAGFTNLTLKQVSNMRLHGVTPEFAASLRQLGFDNLTAQQLTNLKIHGVNEAYIKETQALSAEKLSINDLLQIKISGASPAYARQLKALGFDNVPLRKLSQLHLHGVTEAYIQEMRGLGFDNLTVDQLIKLRIHGVDSEYVKKMRAAGLKNVSLNQLIEMKITGVDSILLKSTR